MAAVLVASRCGYLDPMSTRRNVGVAAVALLALALAHGAVGVAAADSILSIQRPGATATAQAERVVTGPVAGSRFTTLAPGVALPGDQACAAAVRPAAEVRPTNHVPNHTPGVGTTDGYPRVTGNFTGTTDELIQWVACKWGIDEDVVRAQIVKESWWYQSAGGDRTTDPNLCHPLVRDELPCPESVGLGQVRYQYHMAAFANANAVMSSAYNLDYTYAIWRSCFEGELDWLNTVERGAEYVAGDMWGCLGVWFSGRWYGQPATAYIAAVQEILTTRVWESPGFRAG